MFAPTGCSLLFGLRERENHIKAIIASKAARLTPTPIPACWPAVRPDEPFSGPAVCVEVGDVVGPCVELLIEVVIEVKVLLVVVLFVMLK